MGFVRIYTCRFALYSPQDRRPNPDPRSVKCKIWELGTAISAVCFSSSSPSDNAVRNQLYRCAHQTLHLTALNPPGADHTTMAFKFIVLCLTPPIVHTQPHSDTCRIHRIQFGLSVRPMPLFVRTIGQTCAARTQFSRFTTLTGLHFPPSINSYTTALLSYDIIDS